MATLGVRIEVVSVSVVQGVKSRGELAQEHRASVANAARRQDRFEHVAVCPECACELDVPTPAHSPRCPRFVPTPSATGGGTEMGIGKGGVFERGRDGRIQSASAIDRNGAKTIGEMNREEARAMDLAPLLTICGIGECVWRFSGSALDGRAAALEHRAEAHPDWQPFKGKQRRPLPRPVVRVDVEDAGLAALEATDAGVPQPRIEPLNSHAPIVTPDVAPIEEEEMVAVEVPARAGTKKTWSRKAITREEGLALFRAACIELGRVPTAAEWRALERRPSHSWVMRVFGSWEAFGHASSPSVVSPESEGSGRAAARPPVSVEQVAEPVPDAPASLELEPVAPGCSVEDEARPDEPSRAELARINADREKIDAHLASLEVAKREVDDPAADPPEVVHPVGGGFTLHLDLGLTGDFTTNAALVRAKSRELRAQAAALDVIADGIDQLAEASA